MKKFTIIAGMVASLIASGSAFAGEKTVKLAVENMYCASCPFIVKQVLNRVPGVDKVVVSYPEKSATVTYDDSKTNVEQLTDATFEQGYPSELVTAGS